MLNKLTAVCLLVEDFEKSLEFFTKVMGAKVNSTNGKFADFKLGETALAIFEKSEAVSMFPKKYMRPAGGYLLAYTVKDINKSCKKLKERGVEIFEGPKTTPWGQKVAYFHDPDKNIWEISEPLEA